MVKSINPSTSPWTLASPAKKAALSPASISARHCLPLSSFRPLTTTLAPSRRKASAMPRPIERVPPVMQATIPSSLAMIPPVDLSVVSVSVRRAAAVDRDERSGDASSRVGGEQHGDGGDLVHRVEPLDRRLVGEVIEQLL